MRLDETLYTIFAYENSINLPDSERWTRQSTSKQFGNYIELTTHPKITTETPLTLEEYADKCREYLRFGKEVDEVLYGKYNLHEYLKICDTPQILLDAGFKQKPILYTQKHLRLALEAKTFSNPHKHGLSLETIKRLPSLIASPVILADNPSREDAMLMVLCEVDGDKLPLIASIKPDASGNYQLEEIETNLILTVFGKNNFDRYFKSALTPDRILYFNKERGQALERLSERQLLGDYSRLNLFDTIIRKPQCIVNEKQAQKSVISLASEASSLRQAAKELSHSSLSSCAQDSIKKQENNR